MTLSLLLLLFPAFMNPNLTSCSHCFFFSLLLLLLFLVSAASNAQMWILCIAAGGFLYIGFAQLLPELHKTLDSTWKHLALGLMFMTLGFFILILLAVYEEPLLNHFCVV